MIYLEMYRDIKEKIEKQLYPVGMFLPSERELQKEYSVSRTTVRHVISLLQTDGYIRVQQGYGTEVIKNKVSQSLNSITSVSESIRQMGCEVGVGSMHIERIGASYELASELKLKVGESVILISRVQTSNGVPITIAKNYIPEKLVPNIINEKEKIVSLYQYIHERYSIGITRVEDRISACSASFEEAAALGIEPKSALILIRRICYMCGTPVEIDHVKIVASKYEYKNNFNMEE